MADHTTPTNPADLLRQVAEHAPKVLPERIVKPLLSALTFLAKDGHDTSHHWLAGRLARGVLALPEPSAVPATQDDLREQAGAAVMALLKRLPLAPPDQFGGLVGRLGATERDVADAVLTVVNPVLEGLRAERDEAQSLRETEANHRARLAEMLDEERRANSQEIERLRAEVEQWRATYGETALRDATAIIAERDAYRAEYVQMTRNWDAAREANNKLLSRPSVSDQTPTTPDDGDERPMVNRIADLIRSGAAVGTTATDTAREIWACLEMTGQLAAPSSVQGDTTPTAPDDDELAREYMCRDCGHPKGPFDQDDTWQCDRHRAPSEDTTGGQQ